MDKTCAQCQELLDTESEILFVLDVQQWSLTNENVNRGHDIVWQNDYICRKCLVPPMENSDSDNSNESDDSEDAIDDTEINPPST